MSRRVVLACLCLALLGDVAAALAGELIRYRRPDGSVGFTGSASDVPPGAVVLRREPSSDRAARPAFSPPVRLDRALAGVRRHCIARHGEAGVVFESCLADHTEAAFAVRDAVAAQQPGSVEERLIAACRRRWERDRVPDYRRLANCIEDAQSEYESDTGVHPARVDVDAPDRPDRGSGPQAQRRLRDLRDDQARAAEELERGRATWGPRYRKAERELEAASAETRRIEERMRSRGCRLDSLACGGLPERLAAARRREQEKRSYLENGLVNECRLAGCQPGWLR
jgi:hypothetical protein